MLQKITTFCQSILSKFKPGKKRKKLTFDNWSTLHYNTVVYQIARVSEKPELWGAYACLFFSNNKTNINNDDVLILPMEQIADVSPERVFVYLQLIGPLFYNTSSDVIVTIPHGDAKDQMVVVKIWNLMKTASEQGINYNMPLPEEQKSFVKQTNEGNVTIN